MNSSGKSSILLTGGGTGGHLAIVRAVKEELLKRGIKPYYIGSTAGQDRNWFEDDEDFEEKLFLPSKGVVNKKGVAKLSSLMEVLRSAMRAGRFMKSRSVDAVLSVGGFSAAPASFAAVALRAPLFVHEQNAVSGKLNRILKPFAKSFFNSYGNGAVSYPVSDIFFEKARIRESVESVIFLGGSQGARAINDFALSVAPKLKGRGIKIIHQTGGADLARVKMGYEKQSIEADIFPFSKEIAEKIAEADFAVSRAGASTLWELAANGIPTLFVPYPYAAGDHQYHNAKYLADKDAGWVLREEELRRESFWKIIEDEDMQRVSERLRQEAKRGGA
ncbi:MAG: undecaprenyldiphospho-muramoylpentapeptide beta-N-acetylglucosaminyltransferase, partial [Hydrogenimonas sp.]|nr:undecaprenyldiphospho-muramoylpentapeptide beta-N-acetylglucosaminyltransferase [Hydrogenimonas sp.]